MNPPDRLTVKEYPIFWWIFGGLAIAMGVFILASSRQALIFALVLFAAGILFALVIPTITTITADKTQGALTIKQSGLVRRSARQYALKDVVSVEVERSAARHHQSGHHSTQGPTFRIVFVLASGERVPLHSYYDSGWLSKESRARRLREFLGLPEPASAPTVQQAVRQLLTNNPVAHHQGQTDGVPWQIEVAGAGNMIVTRWTSQYVQFPGRFLFLAQTVKGDTALRPGGFLGGLAQFAQQQALAAYGFQPAETPGLETAQPVEPPDPQLAPYFTTMSSDPAGARQLLTPWVVGPLAAWAEQHPVRRVQRPNSGEFGQLVVLFAPQALNLAFLGDATPEQMDAVSRLGAGIVRALVSIPAAPPQ